MDFAGKSVLVVGASGALGGGLASALAEQGATVMATCSTPESVGRIPASAHVHLQVDLNNPDSIDVLADYLLGNHNLDGIVLAAGRVGFGGSQHTSVTDATALTQVNYLGQAHLVSRLIPLLKAGDEPFVAAITGVVAEKTFPGMHAYTASKTAMSAWVTSLRTELRRDGIRVLEARPGHTETGLATRALFGAAPAMPAGMAPDHVVGIIMDGLAGDATVLDSGAF